MAARLDTGAIMFITREAGLLEVVLVFGTGSPNGFVGPNKGLNLSSSQIFPNIPLRFDFFKSNIFLLISLYTGSTANVSLIPILFGWTLAAVVTRLPQCNG